MDKKSQKVDPSKSELSQREVKLRQQQERLDLLFKADELLPKKTIDKELEKFHLYSGEVLSIRDINEIISESVNDCLPMFPNSNPFFRLMYGLLGWDHLNPDDFQKPACVALYIKQFVYARFDKRVLPSLLSRPNPYVQGHIRKYKLYQFLNETGLKMMEGFINDANNVMRESKDWRDFELKYSKKFYLSIQLKIFDQF